MTTLLDVSQTVCHWGLYQRIKDVPGAIVECGVFRGRTLLRFAQFRQICREGRHLIGFDTFGMFPEAGEEDKTARQNFVTLQGNKSLSLEEVRQLLWDNQCSDQVTLVKGDICQTVPQFAQQTPGLRIALLNMDVDLYEPTKTVLEHLYPKLAEGGLLLCDDYNIFPGATRATKEYCRAQNLDLEPIELFSGYYIQKEKNGRHDC